jgi:hypothetical protein
MLIPMLMLPLLPMVAVRPAAAVSFLRKKNISDYHDRIGRTWLLNRLYSINNSIYLWFILNEYPILITLIRNWINLGYFVIRCTLRRVRRKPFYRLYTEWKTTEIMHFNSQFLTSLPAIALLIQLGNYASAGLYISHRFTILANTTI